MDDSVYFENYLDSKYIQDQMKKFILDKQSLSCAFDKVYAVKKELMQQVQKPIDSRWN